MANVIASHDADGATAEVLLPTRVLPAGGDAEFEVRLTSKRDAFEVRDVTVAFQTRYRTAESYREFTAGERVIAADLSTGERLTETEARTVPVPRDLPSTTGTCDSWVEVRFDAGRETVEYRAQVQIRSTPPVRAVIDTMLELGFALRDAECVVDRSSRRLPFVQRIEFGRTGDAQSGTADTVDVFVQPADDETRVFAAIDRDGDDPEPVARASDAELVVRNDESERVRERLSAVVG